MVSLERMFKIIVKIFVGILITMCTILFSGFVLTFLAEQFINGYIDAAPFLIEYPLLIISFLGIYLVFWKKQYALTVGLFLGFFIFQLLMIFIFEFLAGPASL
jgi:ABC-type Fe3+-siderophore transport system permease subunit